LQVGFYFDQTRCMEVHSLQVGFYFDQTRCIGCSACAVACKDWHDIPAGPEKWMTILYNESGKFPDVFVSYLIRPCFQCEDPVCIPVCPVEAITKREEDGIVVGGGRQREMHRKRRMWV